MQLGFLCAMVFLVATANGAKFMMRLKEIPGYPDRCFEPGKGLYMLRGTTDSPLGECISYTCFVDDVGPLLEVSTCGVVGTSPECSISGEDTTKRYPDCCPQPICQMYPNA